MGLDYDFYKSDKYKRYTARTLSRMKDDSKRLYEATDDLLLERGWAITGIFAYDGHGAATDSNSFFGLCSFYSYIKSGEFDKDLPFINEDRLKAQENCIHASHGKWMTYKRTNRTKWYSCEFILHRLTDEEKMAKKLLKGMHLR